MKIITGIFKCNYIDERTGSIYKNDALLSITIRNIIFPDYNYIIYTDRQTIESGYYDFSHYKKDNVTIKEINLDDYALSGAYEELRKKYLTSDDIGYERTITVNNYAKVMHNKKNFLINSIDNLDEDYVWIDSGLFGTSCSDAWRDRMEEICHTKNFLDKLQSKIKNHQMFFLTGSKDLINYRTHQLLTQYYQGNYTPECSVSGGLFGGKGRYIKEFFDSYDDILSFFIKNNFPVCDQDVFVGILSKYKDRITRYNFAEWNDYQKPILEILDVYNPMAYSNNKVYIF